MGRHAGPPGDAPVPTMPGLTSSPTTPRQRRDAFLTCGVLLLIGLAILPVARSSVSPVSAVLPVMGAASLLGDLILALLLLGQFAGSRTLPSLSVGLTYLCSGLLAIPYVLTLPGLQVAALPSTGGVATWLWLFRHGVLPLGLLATIPLSQRWGGRRLSTRHVRYLIVYAPLLVALLSVLLTWLAVWTPHVLPVQVGSRGASPPFAVGPGLLVWLINVVAFSFWLLRLRGRTVAGLWLNVAALGSLLDTTLALASDSPTSLGWHLAAVIGFGATLAVLGVLLLEVGRLYARLLWQERTTAHIVGQLREVNRDLLRLAREDALTGLLNRRAVLDAAGVEMARWRRYGRPFSVLLLDVDDFKAINDRYGHLEGDRVLTAVARTLRRSLRTVDVVGRYGGEEFLVILPEIGLQRAAAAGNHIVETMHTLDLDLGGQPVAITVSIGAASVAADDDSLAALVRRADDALYTAKGSGKDRLSASSQPGERKAGSVL